MQLTRGVNSQERYVKNATKIGVGVTLHSEPTNRRLRSEGQARYGQARSQWMRMIGRSDTPGTRKAFDTTPQARRVTLAANTLLAQENAKVTANYNNARIQIAKDLEQDKLNIDQRASDRVRRNYAQQTSNIEKEYYSRYDRTVASARTDMRRLSRLPAPFMAQALRESGYHGEYDAAMRRLIYHDRRGGIEDRRAGRERRRIASKERFRSYVDVWKEDLRRNPF